MRLEVVSASVNLHECGSCLRQHLVFLTPSLAHLVILHSAVLNLPPSEDAQGSQVKEIQRLYLSMADEAAEDHRALCPCDGRTRRKLQKHFLEMGRVARCDSALNVGSARCGEGFDDLRHAVEDLFDGGEFSLVNIQLDPGLHVQPQRRKI